LLSILFLLIKRLIKNFSKKRERGRQIWIGQCQGVTLEGEVVIKEKKDNKNKTKTHKNGLFKMQ